MQRVIKKDFPIKGTFKIEQVERMLKESKITFGIALLHIESDKLEEDLYSIYGRYPDPLRDIIVKGEVRPQVQNRRQDRSTVEMLILKAISSKIDELYIKPDVENRDYDWIIFCKWLVDNINIKDRSLMKNIKEINKKLSKKSKSIKRHAGDIDIFGDQRQYLNMDAQAVASKIANSLDPVLHRNPDDIKKNLHLLRALFLYMHSSYVRKKCQNRVEEFIGVKNEKLRWTAHILGLSMENGISFGQSPEIQIYSGWRSRVSL